MIDFKTFNRVSQLSHFGWGAMAVFFTFAIGLDFDWIYRCVVPLLIAAAALKEFWYDQNYETPEVRGSNLQDFFFYLVGISFAVGTLFIRWEIL